MTRIEDYGLIGDTHTAALVSRGGSIDWLCLPRFDSGACFAALLGGDDHGRWLIAPRGGYTHTSRQYLEGTLVLQTVFETHDGEVEVLDFMPFPSLEDEVDVMRVVRGRRGSVPMEMELVLRFDYGSVVPWVRRRDFGLTAIAGPNAVSFHSPVALENKDFRTRANFTVREKDEISFTLTWHPSHHPQPPQPILAARALDQTIQHWRRWSEHYKGGGSWRDAAKRSLITLKALTYAPTGGIVAAPTTSLPEQLGNVRNWDYRYCWLRDATFTLYTLLVAGFVDEAIAWRDWLLRAIAGKPEQLQIMFGLGGERLLPEYEIDWLPGYEGSEPVRVGNAAHRQFQLDVYGEVMDVFHVARRSGISPDEDGWLFQKELLGTLERVWRQPDEGLWEVRGPRRNFTHSKMMAWVAFDRGVKAIEQAYLDGPLDKWRRLREEVKRDVLEHGYDPEQNAFVQYYGTKDLDAALLMMPLVGFLPPNDPRVVGTIDAIQRRLMADGFVRRYVTKEHVDGLPEGEGFFLPCTFWLADALILQGKREEGLKVFQRASAAANDLGLFSEEFDPASGRQLGNFPQAFTHVAFVNTIHNLALPETGPAQARSQQ
ncbi:MAG: glycoside hydrolase family 15 protein [Hyphomicrobiales bacterium]